MAWSGSKDRILTTYLRPRTFMMFIADAKNKIRSESSLSNDIITKHYESLPQSHQEALINDYHRYLESEKAKKKK